MIGVPGFHCKTQLTFRAQPETPCRVVISRLCYYEPSAWLCSPFVASPSIGSLYRARYLLRIPYLLPSIYSVRDSFDDEVLSSIFLLDCSISGDSGHCVWRICSNSCQPPACSQWEHPRADAHPFCHGLEESSGQLQSGNLWLGRWKLQYVVKADASFVKAHADMCQIQQ
jgi:hypothetical protein